MKPIYDPVNDPPCPEIGAKAASLLELQRAGVEVPPWWVLLPGAIGPAAPGRSEWSQGALDEIGRALAGLCPDGERVAVRSSALEEDGARHSFAGQFDSFLSVPHDEVPDRIADVWRSAFSPRNRAYREQHGLPMPTLRPAVLVQRMVNADAAGVAFSADPVTGREDVVVISAVSGLGDRLVSGECEGETYRLEAGGGHGATDDSCKGSVPRGSQSGGVPPQSIVDRTVLSRSQVEELAGMVRQIGRHFGAPQDIEWAMKDETFFFLQSRPITTPHRPQQTEGVLHVWDNSNITESYGGITTPLTFSFARRAYEGVYREFCRLLKVPQRRLKAHDQAFRCMLGYLRGRIYYNLLNWYRTLALLPGFRINRTFMEQMMGVKEGLPDAIVRELEGGADPDAAVSKPEGRFMDGLHLARSAGALLTNHFRMNSRIAEFRKRLDDALAQPDPPLSQRQPDQLIAAFNDLERKLLTRWDAPLLNDFLAMIFFGVLRRLGAKWCGDGSDAIVNALFRDTGGIISAEPARQVRRLAAMAASDSTLADLLSEGSAASIRDALATVPELREGVARYLERFGDRCLDELKLESPTLHDDPMPLYRSIGRLARNPGRPDPAEPQTPPFPRSAEAQLDGILRGRPIRRWILRWVLGHARERVRQRENLRFERTRLFGRVRRIFVELGHRFQRDQVLENAHDIFCLELQEIFGFVDGTGTCADLKGLVRLRKTELARYQEQPAPPDRFETRGPAGLGLKDVPCSDSEPTGEQRQGLGCSPGIRRGRVRVIANPREETLQCGEILVAERTDPGWILLFSSAAGLIVERGSLLSHSAIIARELGIPAAVSVPDATRWLKTGDLVELDGANGVVIRISEPANPCGDRPHPAGVKKEERVALTHS